jgi:hypothetical protein
MHDALKGYWQFPLAEESQEIMSFQTDTTVYTPTRLIQGGTDSVFAFQNGIYLFIYLCTDFSLYRPECF